MSTDGKQRVVIAGGARTPVGIKCGSLGGFAAEDLAVIAGDEAIQRAGIKAEDVDAAVGANVYQFTAPGGQDIYFPRNVALRVGMSIEAPALMVQRICGSGFETVISAMQQLMMPNAIDDTSVALCFGAETMSRAPRINRASRKSGPQFWEFDSGDQLEDTILAGLNHELFDTAMMITADEYGHRMGITRDDCDAFAFESHARARAANRKSVYNGGDHLSGLVPVDAIDRNGCSVYLAHDECVRATSKSELARLPGFTPHKLVSPGNASEIADGAGAVVVTNYAHAIERGMPAQFEVVSYGVVGVDPKIMGQGPVPSIRKAVKNAGLTVDDIDLYEINEAFAAQYLGVEKELELDRSKVNVNGGAVAIGHPLGCTGVRLLVDLMYEMNRQELHYGCASACIGGGQGTAVVLRNLAVQK